MKIEIEVTDEIEDALVIESLRTNLECLLADETKGSPWREDVVDFRAAFKLVLEYYGG